LIQIFCCAAPIRSNQHLCQTNDILILPEVALQTLAFEMFGKLGLLVVIFHFDQCDFENASESSTGVL
jgi:hypothetical protein